MHPPLKTSGRVSEHRLLTSNQAHPKAQKLLNDPFFWSLTEVSAPFGNEEGATALAGFHKWRPAHPGQSPVVYLNNLIAGWNYPSFDLTNVTLDGISAYLTTESAGPSALIGQDNAIIAVGFGQFVLEGRMDKEIWILTKIALQRELLPVLLSHFPEAYQPRRRELLSRLLQVVGQL